MQEQEQKEKKEKEQELELEKKQELLEQELQQGLPTGRWSTHMALSVCHILPSSCPHPGLASAFVLCLYLITHFSMHVIYGAGVRCSHFAHRY